jgi:hypothetical protein
MVFFIPQDENKSCVDRKNLNFQGGSFNTFSPFITQEPSENTENMFHCREK